MTKISEAPSVDELARALYEAEVAAKRAEHEANPKRVLRTDGSFHVFRPSFTPWDRLPEAVKAGWRRRVES